MNTNVMLDAILVALNAIADHLEEQQEVSVGIFVGRNVAKIREAITQLESLRCPSRTKLFPPDTYHCDQQLGHAGWHEFHFDDGHTVIRWST